ncbi:MAG: alpha/beta hydrolase [Sciscionella sp.]
MRREIPGHEGSVTTLTSRTTDGVDLRGALIEQPDGDADLAIVVGHGVTNTVAKPFVARVLRRLSRSGAVIAFDFRGHGRSGGHSTIGDREILDIDAAVEVARERGYTTVATVGFSMGAAVVLRHAALCGGVDTVAAVSGPSRWWVRDTAAMRRVHWMLEDPLGRAVAPVVGVRLGPHWGEPPPASPIEVISRIAPVPLLLLHGTEDRYFSPEHAVALQRASGGHAELWLEQGMQHAESAMTPALTDRLGGWLRQRAGSIGATPSGDYTAIAMRDE